MKRPRFRGLSDAATAPPISLNIKNSEACRLIQELAELTGESMTAAVTEAVRERLYRLREAKAADLAERLLTIGRACAGRLGAECRALEHDALPYHSKGLPR